MQPQEMINNFNHSNKNMVHDEIIFHLRRGETLLIQSEKGEWLKSYYWGRLPNDEYAPIIRNWKDRSEFTSALNKVPHIGPQIINNESVIVSFCKFSNNAPIWKPGSPEFITALPTFNLRENIESELTEKKWNCSELSKKSKVPLLIIERFLTENNIELNSDQIQKIASAFEISEAKLRGYGSNKDYISLF